MSQTAGTVIDETTDFGARAARHLREDFVVWLTTVSPTGKPQPSPVWFLWDGATTVRVHSLATTSRARNLAANPNVSLNFGGDHSGGDIVVFSGTAREVPDAEPAAADASYVAKYAAGLARIGLTAEQFSLQYSAVIEITLTGLRGH